MAKPSQKSGRVKPGAAKKLSDTKVRVNLKGVEAGTRKAVRVPEGDYLFKVKKAEVTTFKSGNDGVVWIFEFVDGKGKGSGVYHNSVFTENSLWSFKGIVQSLRPVVKLKDGEMDIDVSKLIGRTVGGSVLDDEYDGKIKSIINDFFPPELLEDDEEEDEELEEEELEDEEEDEEEEDEEDEDDEVEEDEEDEEDVDYYELSAPELRAYAVEQGIKTKGLKKVDILEALDELFGEEEDEDEEDWDDEVDLDDDDL